MKCKHFGKKNGQDFMTTSFVERENIAIEEM